MKEPQSYAGTAYQLFVEKIRKQWLQGHGDTPQYAKSFLSALGEYLEYPDLKIGSSGEYKELDELWREILSGLDSSNPRQKALRFARALNEKGHSRQLDRIEERLDKQPDNDFKGIPQGGPIVKDPQNFRTEKRGALKYLLNKEGKLGGDGFHKIYYDERLNCLVGKLGAKKYLIDPYTGEKASKGYHKFYHGFPIQGRKGNKKESAQINCAFGRLTI